MSNILEIHGAGNKILANNAAICYTMDAVNESGCLKGEPMNRQPNNMVNQQSQKDTGAANPRPRESGPASRPNKQLITAAYERLSRDDERETESLSIEHQKFMLEDYAKKNGFTNLVHFTDDGISGTRWDRPGFTKMLDEIEAGNVAVCLCKDTSRLGRDYLRVGLFMDANVKHKLKKTNLFF